MSVELRDYQQTIVAEGTSILQEWGILYLAMEVRTGKTLTSLHIAEAYGAHSVLFVTKKKAISSIDADYQAMDHTFNIDIVNYESLHKLTDDEREEYDFIIVDEAHSLGAFPLPSQRARNLRAMVGTNPLILLSGTPTPESWAQIYHQFWISQNSPFTEPNFYKWSKVYCFPKLKYFFNRQVTDYSDADYDAIQEKVSHLFITYTQAQAGFTQLVEEEVVHVKMSGRVKWLMQRLIQDRVVENADGQRVIADTEVKLMQKLHQICSGTVLIDEPEREGSAFDHSKAEYIKQRFAGQKIAIFYKFVAERHMLMWVFAGRIVETPKEFNASGPEKVYISQVQSGREGINLSAADALVMLNIDFSAVSYWQSRARMQSKDRDRAARVVWVFSEGGIEDKIYKRVLEKKDYTLRHFCEDYGVKKMAKENRNPNN